MWGQLAEFAAKRWGGEAVAALGERQLSNYAARKGADWAASEAGQAMMSRYIGPKLAARVATPTGQKLAKHYVKQTVRKVVPGGRGEDKSAETPKTMFVQAPNVPGQAGTAELPNTNQMRYRYANVPGTPQQMTSRTGTFDEGYRYANATRDRSSYSGTGGTANWWQGHAALSGVQPNEDWRSVKFNPVAKGGSWGKKSLIGEGKTKDAIRAFQDQRGINAGDMSERTGDEWNEQMGFSSLGKPLVSATGNPEGFSSYPRKPGRNSTFYGASSSLNSGALSQNKSGGISFT